MLSITDAFQNLYTYIISIAGVIALAALIIGGILYLTSAGDPEKLSKAKKQILAAFFGIIILLSSSLILRTINPELVSFEMPELEEIVFHPLDKPAPETKIPQLLDNVKEATTDKCDCKNTQPLCVCTGGDEDAKCEPRQNYVGPGSNPCIDFKEIKNQQKIIVAWKDEILYYRNRNIAEEEDLKEEIEKVLNEQIRYYTESKAVETDEKIIEYFEDEITKLEKEKQLKQSLAVQLERLAKLIEEAAISASEIGILPDKCLYDKVFGVNNKCNAYCEGDCHDIKTGCEPLKSDGGNPCPAGEINDQLLTIQQIRPLIISASDQILNIIQEIIKLKTITR